MLCYEINFTFANEQIQFHTLKHSNDSEANVRQCLVACCVDCIANSLCLPEFMKED